MVAILVQPDGKIVLGGSFTQLNTFDPTPPCCKYDITYRNNLARLNPDGTVDASFDPGANNTVWRMVLQPDGKIVVGGFFTTLGGGGTGTTARNYLGRLNPDGTLDASFDPGADGVVEALGLEPDGNIVVGGMFTTLGGGGTGITARNFIGRLANTDAAFQDLAVDCCGSTVVWRRSGSSPEVGRTSFEMSTDGIHYTPLGSGARVAGGWQMTGLVLPVGRTWIRTRAFYSSGALNSSGSIVQSVRAAWISSQAGSDFNGDAKMDILWRHDSTGALFIWMMNGVVPSSILPAGTVADLTWRIQRVGDFNRDGKADILWRHNTTGQLFMWLMDGFSIIGYQPIGIVSDLGWQIQK